MIARLVSSVRLTLFCVSLYYAVITKVWADAFAIHVKPTLHYCAFQSTSITTIRSTIGDSHHHHRSSSSSSSSKLYSSVASKQLADIRSQIEANEEANLLIQALRGNGMNDDDRAAEGVTMQLVDIYSGGSSRDSNLKEEYDPIALKEFFSKRPMAVLTRVVQIVTVGGTFLASLASDILMRRNNYKENPDLEVKRAAQLRDIITSLGPFFIKLGQALSIRPDVLSPRTMVELQKLCDKVPSYDSKIAFATIEQELGRSMDDLFLTISPEPIAAASLGQVYRATLRDTGETVAVKVQRPAVLETVSLDLYLARELGLIIKALQPNVRLDAVALLDEFAYRFYQELDYKLECENGLKIRQQMSVLPMVVVPMNYPKYTSRRVHVAEWIEGEKLSQSKADDVGALINLGVIAYLTQLLEFGFFHADPHPGNMMRTTDGKLAILDFGLMTEITDDQKYGMIEAIAHLLNRDYTEIGQDFVNLDFIPKGTDTRPIVPALTKVFDVALAGGGAKSINFQELAGDLAQITFDYPFSIPPYFALVIRAISVLEGIALVGNPNFAIIDEAYPYIARRLMTDQSPRLKATLKYMVYGRDGEFDAERLIDLLQALEKFTAVRDGGDGSAFKVEGVRGNRYVGQAGDYRGSQLVDISDRETDVGDGRFRVTLQSNDINRRSGAASVAADFTKEDRDEETVREALRFFFSPEGQVFREFMLEEIVTVVDATSREAVQELTMALGIGNALPSFFRALSPQLSDKDRRVVKQIRKLVQFLFGDFESAIDSDSSNGGGVRQTWNNRRENNERLRKLIPVAREYGPQFRDLGGLLVIRLSEKSISRGINWATGRVA